MAHVVSTACGPDWPQAVETTHAIGPVQSEIKTKPIMNAAQFEDHPHD